MKNKLICGDNLEILATLETESVDLIYIDPPFFSNRNYEIIWGDEAEIRSFEDRWEGGISVYVDWMKQRVLELYRVLKPTGSFYLHCDYHASHYLKMMCDDIFGYHNFRNEVIWHYKFRMMDSDRIFNRKHDTLLFYAKTPEAKLNMNAVAEKWTRDEIIRVRKQAIYKDEAGKEWIWMPGGRGHSKNKKKYLDDIIKEGKALDDVWDMPIISSSAKERSGYPTQKPELLLQRVIKASSNRDDVVLDAFCGCGTAMVVAQKLGRQWIGIDISPSAISLVKNRLAKICDLSQIADVIGMPTNVEELKNFKPFDFQYWVVNEMHGTPSSKKVGDMGIDGLSFLRHYPIQVKQSESVGRPVVDSFQTALRRYYKDRTKDFIGYIVAFSFTKGAHEEVARIKNEGYKIELITVQRLLDRKYTAPSDGELFAG
jgi:DNA modification methylase